MSWFSGGEVYARIYVVQTMFVQLGVWIQSSLFLPSQFQTVVCWLFVWHPGCFCSCLCVFVIRFLSVCGCYFVYQWRTVGLFVTLHVFWHEQENVEENKINTYLPWCQSILKWEASWSAENPLPCCTSLSDFLPSDGTLEQCPAGRMSVGSKKCTASLSNHSRLPSTRDWQAVSDKPSKCCCSPQHSDLQVMWFLGTSLGVEK